MGQRSSYNLQLTCNAEEAAQTIQAFLNANNFERMENNGVFFYMRKDAMAGNWCFAYSINNGVLNIEAWLNGAFGDVGIEQDGIMNMNAAVMAYRDALNRLFQTLGQLGSKGESAENNTNNQQNGNQFAQNFQDQTMKKKETLCEIGFWISIAGLLLAFAGISASIIVYIMDFYFASQGLKTRKRGKAIATIVLSAVSVVVIIAKIIMVLVA